MRAPSEPPRSTAWWHYRRSLAGRVTILTTFAVGLSILVIALGAYVVIRHQIQANTDSSLLRRAHAMVNDNSVIASLDNDTVLPIWALGASDIKVALLQPDEPALVLGGKADTFPALGAPEEGVLAGGASYSIRTSENHRGVSFRVAAVPLPDQDSALVLAESLSSQNRMYRRLSIVMICFGFAGAVIAGFFGWFVASGGLRPVRRLTEDVERIARTEDLTPIPVEGDDEIARLATAFNGLLVGLDASRLRQRQLVADASHELRTPLTSLRTNIDLLTQADAAITGSQRQELMSDVRAQIEEMTTLIGDLVELARDAPPAQTVGVVDVPEVLDHALERVRRRAPSLTWEVTAENWWTVAEPSGMERAITNLLDNAAKWSPRAGTVRVTLRAGTLTVDDDGPGIDEADLPHVFDRFFRSTESRSMPGSGLGLAIVRQVAERAGGSVEACRSPYGGARLVMRLPGSTKPAPHRSPTGVS